MMPFNNCDKLTLIQLLIIWGIVEQSDCNVNNNKICRKNSANVKHKINTESILPIQEANIEGHTKSIKKNNEKNGEINTNTNIDTNTNNNTNTNTKTNTNTNTNTNTTNNNNTTDNGIHETPENINTNHSEDFISTIPIIIAEKNIDIPIESTFKLKSAALEIKNIKKDVYLTNSVILPMYEKHNNSTFFKGKLFLEGFIRNKLDFSIAKDVYEGIINLDTECIITYIPFKCTTLIQFNVPPVYSKEKDLDYIPVYMSSDCVDINSDYPEYLQTKNTKCKEYIHSDIPPINCEIKEVKIHETYTLVDKTPFNKDFPIEMNFHTIKENIIINLSLTLLQKQDVAIIYRNNHK